MQESDQLKLLKFVAAVAGGAVLLLLICRPSEPSVELARTAREAVVLAREADSAVTSAVLWSTRFRLLAIAVGVSVPIVVAYLICRSSAKADPDAADLLECLEQHGLSELASLPSPEPPADRLPATAAANHDDPPQA